MGGPRIEHASVFCVCAVFFLRSCFSFFKEAVFCNQQEQQQKWIVKAIKYSELDPFARPQTPHYFYYPSIISIYRFGKFCDGAIGRHVKECKTSADFSGDQLCVGPNIQTHNAKKQSFIIWVKINSSAMAARVFNYAENVAYESLWIPIVAT